MRNFFGGLCGAVVLVLASAMPAFAWGASGYVYCDSNQNGQVDSTDTPMAGVKIMVRAVDGTWQWGWETDTAGFYYVGLKDVPAEYVLTIDTASLPAGATVVTPAGGTMNFTDAQSLLAPILINSPTCVAQKCWLTGGGAKFSAVTGTMLAEHGPRHSFGGNVNPGCNTDSGEGGQWNHVAHGLKLHFQGFVIEVVRCGNVNEIPPGSTSPATPYNFIEFRGTGRLVGIQGNKNNWEPVYFWARAEDRNEPGSSGQRDGAYKDRYMLHVFSNLAAPNESTLLLVDVDGDPATIDPVTITDGNLQLHISSCSNPPL